MTFKDWSETAAADPLMLPINNKVYRIPALGYLDAIAIREDAVRTADWFAYRRHLTAVAAGEPGELEPDEVERISNDPPQMSDEEFVAKVLGDTLTQMRADNVPQQAVTHAAMVAHVDAVQGREVAEELWEKGPNPEALAKAIRAAASASSTTSPATPPTAPTSSTKPRASTASTRSRKATASRSSGKTSSRSRA